MLLQKEIAERISEALKGIQSPVSGDVVVSARLTFSRGGYRGMRIETNVTSNFAPTEANHALESK